MTLPGLQPLLCPDPLGFGLRADLIAVAASATQCATGGSDALVFLAPPAHANTVVFGAFSVSV